MMYGGRKEQVRQILRFLRDRYSLHVLLSGDAAAALSAIRDGGETGISFLDGENAAREREAFAAQVSQGLADGLALVFLNAPDDRDLEAAIPRVACNYSDIIRHLSGEEMEGEPEIERVSMAHRKRNGCAEKCRIADECLCSFHERGGKQLPSCYPSPERRCVFCKSASFRRSCLLFNVGREPDFRPFPCLCEKPARFDWEKYYLEKFGPEMAERYLQASGEKRAERPKSFIEAEEEREISELSARQTGRLRRIK